MKSHLLLALDYEIIQLSSLHMLHHQINLAAVLQNLNQLHNVGMSQLLNDAQLARKVDLVLRVNYEAFPQYLCCYFLLCFQVDCILDCSEGASADPLADLIATYYLASHCLLNLLFVHLL